MNGMLLGLAAAILPILLVALKTLRRTAERPQEIILKMRDGKMVYMPLHAEPERIRELMTDVDDEVSSSSRRQTAPKHAVGSHP